MPASKKSLIVITKTAQILKEAKEDWRGGTPVESILNSLEQQFADYFEATVFGFDRAEFINVCELGD